MGWWPTGRQASLLYCTQTAGGLLALVLGVLVVTDQVQLWQVYLLAAMLGVVTVFDNPARQTFVMEMVGRDDLPNAVSLNTVVMNASRVVGPAIGGVVITIFGLGVCFFVKCRLLCRRAHRPVTDAHRRAASDRARGPSQGPDPEGFRYVWRTPRCATHCWPSP